MRLRTIRIRILCLTLPVLMALCLSACSLFGGKGEQDEAETAREESLTVESGKAPSSDNQEPGAPAAAREAEPAEEKPAKAETDEAKPAEEKSAGAAGETQEPEREIPASEGKKENRTASSPDGGKEEEQISWDDFLEPLPERGEAVKEPAQERGEAEPVIDDGEVTLLPEVP